MKKNDWELSCFLHRLVGRDLIRDTTSCWCEFPAEGMIATSGSASNARAVLLIQMTQIKIVFV